ncbi:BlaI/MecI/CopY family transcriptional regulator [Bacteroidota bacterium]
MKELTKAEEQIMRILWNLDKAFVKDIIVHFDNPKPAYNTVSTIIRILEKKGFVAHNAYGKTHEYYPIVNRDDYRKLFLGSFINKYFSNSFTQMVSFFAKENEMGVDEINEIMKIVKNDINQTKSDK